MFSLGLKSLKRKLIAVMLVFAIVFTVPTKSEALFGVDDAVLVAAVLLVFVGSAVVSYLVFDTIESNQRAAEEAKENGALLTAVTNIGEDGNAEWSHSYGSNELLAGGGDLPPVPEPGGAEGEMGQPPEEEPTA